MFLPCSFSPPFLSNTSFLPPRSPLYLTHPPSSIPLSLSLFLPSSEKSAVVEYQQTAHLSWFSGSFLPRILPPHDSLTLYFCRDIRPTRVCESQACEEANVLLLVYLENKLLDHLKVCANLAMLSVAEKTTKSPPHTIQHHPHPSPAAHAMLLSCQQVAYHAPQSLTD